MLWTSRTMKAVVPRKGAPTLGVHEIQTGKPQFENGILKIHQRSRPPENALSDAKTLKKLVLATSILNRLLENCEKCETTCCCDCSKPCVAISLFKTQMIGTSAWVVSIGYSSSSRTEICTNRTEPFKNLAHHNLRDVHFSSRTIYNKRCFSSGAVKRSDRGRYEWSLFWRMVKSI